MGNFRNRYSTDTWKEDSWASVDFYNNWFLTNAPLAYQTARKGVLEKVKNALKKAGYLKCVSTDTILANPEITTILRACTAPPLAIDRLAGLSHTSKNLIGTLEKGKIPAKIDSETLMLAIPRITAIITRLLDCQIFPWLSDKSYGTPSAQALNRSASIVADRITGSLADPVIRNSQEQRQLSAISIYLDRKGYTFIHSKDIVSPESMPPKSYSFHLNCPVKLSDKEINMPVDVVIQTSHTAQASSMPLLVECKSAGDFTNTNKRRKEEAVKAMQLRQTYGDNINYILFLCGYFDSTYLGYEASEQIDWVWEHRISDFDFFAI